MKLTIITGPQGSGKTAMLKAKQFVNSNNNYHVDRLNAYPLHLPSLSITVLYNTVITFDEVTELQHFYMLAAIVASKRLSFKTTSPGTILICADIDIFITTQTPKKDIQHIFKGLPGVSFIELGKDKKVKHQSIKSIMEKGNKKVVSYTDTDGNRCSRAKEILEKGVDVSNFGNPVQWQKETRGSNY